MKKATRIVLSTFGGLIGLVGVEHGVGEIMQGLVRHDGLMFPSWPDSPFFKILGGEPAISMIPFLFTTGVLACIFSLLYSGWAIFGIDRKRISWTLFSLSVAMLLFGGGLFPPLFGMIIAALTGNRNRLIRWGERVLSIEVGQRMSIAWPWVFGAAVLSWLAMVPGVPLLSTYFEVESNALIFIILGCMFGFIFLSILCGVGKDVWDAAEHELHA